MFAIFGISLMKEKVHYCSFPPGDKSSIYGVSEREVTNLI